MFIARTSGQERIFPPISQELYAASAPPDSPDGRAAQKLLQWAKESLSPGQRFGLGGGAQERWGRTLYHHRTAVALELEGQTTQADFYWREFARCSEQLSGDAAFWRALLDALNPSDLLDALSSPKQLEARVFDEWFLDTHVAFVNGYGHLMEWELDSRAFFHIAAIKRMAQPIELSIGRRRDLLGTPLLIALRLYRSEQEWAKILELSREILETYGELFPPDGPREAQLAEEFRKWDTGRLNRLSREENQELEERVDALDDRVTRYVEPSQRGLSRKSMEPGSGQGPCWCFSVEPTVPKPREEPFFPWLWSRQGAAAKVATALALVALPVTVWFGIQHNQNVARRDALYKELLSLTRQANEGKAKDGVYLSLRKKAESYLSTPLLSTRDNREKGVLKTAQLAYWFHRKQRRKKQRDEAYRQLEKAQTPEAVMRWAGQFLRARRAAVIGGQDPRRSRVRKMYARALLRWFLRQADPRAAQVQARLREYQTLTAQRSQP